MTVEPTIAQGRDNFAIFTIAAELPPMRERSLSAYDIQAVYRAITHARRVDTRVVRMIKWAARRSDVAVRELLEDERARRICRVRWAVMWAAHHALGLSGSQIAFNMRRDHTTIEYGLRRARKLRASNLQFLAFSDSIVEAFSGSEAE